MGMSNGFLTIKRQTADEAHPKSRQQNWEEYQKSMADDHWQTQAARCMNCGTPFCQIGAEWDRVTIGCPLNNLIPEWNELVSQGFWHEAYLRLARTNNFPEFTGRVCPAPCEGSCTAALPTEPVTIKGIERAIIDRAFEEGWIRPRPPKARTGKKVAVIGSGPAGLACADLLNQSGHTVTIYERADRAGGLLMYGIPNMKLEKNLIERRLTLLKAEGIRFKTGIEIGTDILLSELQETHDAVVLCTGATRPRELTIDGRDLEGVHLAMDYLTESTKALLENRNPSIDAAGKDVIVIGGGDTGADCVATALRQNCQSVVQFGRHPRLPDLRPSDNPWPEPPRVFTLDYGYAEAAARFGADPRTYGILAKQLIGNNGKIDRLCTVDVQFQDETLNEIPNTEKEWAADLVLIAMGFEGTDAVVTTGSVMELSKNGTIEAPRQTYRTKLDGVFAAGDARRGQSLIVWAMREGREVALEIDRVLMNEAALS
ncbi:glutamate synthase subunit beta [Camelliibacillus cellulosilyticus]|uniref:Glutamate synthase subunit beta n=1 Tax=Camelliibacillus cellulosilyticus TaxID=2174486 RepID=A0ABV9GMH0_9BACL